MYFPAINGVGADWLFHQIGPFPFISGCRMPECRLPGNPAYLTQPCPMPVSPPRPLTNPPVCDEHWDCISGWVGALTAPGGGAGDPANISKQSGLTTVAGYWQVDHAIGNPTTITAQHRCVTPMPTANNRLSLRCAIVSFHRTRICAKLAGLFAIMPLQFIGGDWLVSQSVCRLLAYRQGVKYTGLIEMGTWAG